MLNLYAFFIFALSSSVTAAPSGRALPLPFLAHNLPPPDPVYDLTKYKELLDSQDENLLKGFWGRVVQAPWEEGAPQDDPRRHAISWSIARDCDDFIQFRSKFSLGVDELNVHRVRRQFSIENVWYRVVRTSPGVGQLALVYPEVPLKEWGTFLNDTQWTREPAIVGEVSNGLGAPAGRLTRFTELGALWGQTHRLDTLVAHE